MCKILHLTYDMRIGGTEQVIKNIINGNDDPNINMGIICIESPLGPFAEKLIKQGVKFYQLNRKKGFDISLIFQLRRIIASNNIDILHCHQYTPWVYGALAAAFTTTKVLFTEHGRFYPDSRSIKRKLVNPILNALTDDITAISKATKEALVKYEYLPKERIKVIYNGIEPLAVSQLAIKELRTTLGIADDTTILGTVARFDPIKNHQMMLKAFRLVIDKQPNNLLIIVGDGDERRTIEHLICELNLTKNVILTGYIKQPKNYIALFDIFLLSSFSEGTSMTLLEALSLGKPCIVTNVGGNPEVILNNINGMVTKTLNPKDFSQVILNVLAKPLLLSDMKEKSIKYFSKNFLNKRMIENYAQIYKKLPCKNQGNKI